MSTAVPADEPCYVTQCYHCTPDGYSKQQECIACVYFQSYPLHLGKYKKKLFQNSRLRSSRFMCNKKESLLYCCCWYCWYCYYHHHNHQHYNHHKHQKKQQKRLLLPLLLMLPLPQPLPKLLLLVLLLVNYNNELNLHHQHEWEFYCSKAVDVVILNGTGKGSGRCKWQRTVNW